MNERKESLAIAKTETPNRKTEKNIAVVGSSNEGKSEKRNGRLSF